MVGDRAGTLSGGQRRRIAVVGGAPVLILDEPTTGLKARSKGALMEAPEKLMDGRNTLMISRKLSTVRRAVKICVVEHGEMAKAGSHEELMGRNGRHAPYICRGSRNTASGIGYACASETSG